MTTEQLLQVAAKKKRNEEGSNVHEKSLISAAKDTEWKKLEEKGDVRILSGASAWKAKAQFGDRFIPSRFVVTHLGPEEFKGSMVSAGGGVWILLSWSLPGSGATQSPTWLGSAVGGTFEVRFWRQTLWIGRKDRCTQVFLQEESQRWPDGSVILVLGNIHGLNDAPQRWWKNFEAVIDTHWFHTKHI